MRQSVCYPFVNLIGLESIHVILAPRQRTSISVTHTTTPDCSLQQRQSP